jgi:hypothetical protein
MVALGYVKLRVLRKNSKIFLKLLAVVLQYILISSSLSDWQQQTFRAAAASSFYSKHKIVDYATPRTNTKNIRDCFCILHCTVLDFLHSSCCCDRQTGAQMQLSVGARCAVAQSSWWIILVMFVSISLYSDVFLNFGLQSMRHKFSLIFCVSAISLPGIMILQHYYRERL